MKSKMMKLIVMGVALASFCLMGCDVKDADGNKYPTTKIGTQVWMAKNLNVNVEGSVCYDNDPANCETFGRLYTWEAAKMSCPAGWHLPSKEEFEVLLDYVKLKTETDVTQKKLKAEKLLPGESEIHTHLRDRNWANGLDTYGFKALTAGYYNSSFRVFSFLGRDANFWSSTGRSYSSRVYFLGIGSDGVDIHHDFQSDGRSVRCLQDAN